MFNTGFTGIRWLVRSKKNRKHAALAVGASLQISVVVGEMTLEHRHLPWRPLAIDERAGLATGFKLRLIDLGPAAWRQDLLAESKLLQTRLLEAHDGKDDCGWSQAYHVNDSGGVSLSGKSTYAMQCDLTVSLIGHSLDRAAIKYENGFMIVDHPISSATTLN